MKKLLLLLLVLSIQIYGQNTKEYLFTPTDENLFVPLSTIEERGFYKLTFSETAIDSLFKNQEIVIYEKAFPKLKSYLNKVYRIVVTETSSLKVKDLLNNGFIEYAELMEEASLASDIIPDDYMLPNGEPNDYLELIRAPMAWSVTKGNPAILVGVADSWFNTVHEELTDKIVGIYGSSTPAGPPSHGIEVASLIAGDTNNGVGLASIGYNTKMVGYVGLTPTAVYELAMIQGVRVINMSWARSFKVQQYEEDLYKELRDDYNIVLVAAAGNRQCGGQFAYCYPASYDEVISVTTSGNQIYRGDWVRGNIDWKDCVQRNVLDSTTTNNINDKVNVTAPGYNIFRATNTNGIQGSVDTYLDHDGATSQASAIVSGLAALILSVNPDLTAAEVKQIIEETTDNIDHIPQNQQYAGKYGTGRINAYRAVMRAKCDLNPSTDLDLMIRDSREDYGQEPNASITDGVFWNSIDIWVRNQEDEIEIHENPVYNPNGTSYVYVRIFNKSCQVSSGTEKVQLYWAKASTSMNWDTFWKGEYTYSNGASFGEPIGELTIPSLEPGQDIVLYIPWEVPNPGIYHDINPDPWHFCLLARIDTPNDPMTYPEQSFITDNVRKNNNIAWKNLTVVNLSPSNIGTPIGGVVSVGNPLAVAKSFDLKFSELLVRPGNNLFLEAEVNVELDAVVFEAWEKGGFQGQHIRHNNSNRIVILSHDALIENLVFEPGELGTVNVTFNFLTKEITENNKYVMNLIQQYSDTKEYFGGEVYEIRKHPRDVFYAHAGEDQEVNKNEMVQLQAAVINEPALYNWYDANGTLIYEGVTFTTSVEIGTKYKLEVISLADGFKDYNEVEVSLKPNSISTIYPNPSSGIIQVNYKINQGSSSYIAITGLYGSSISHNYIIDMNEDTIQIDISQYPAGVYNIVLVSDGVITDSKNLIKE